MTWILIILGFCILGAPLIGFAVLAWLDLAPLGYEDDAGFHFGVEAAANQVSVPSANPPRQRASISPCLVTRSHNNSKRRAAASKTYVITEAELIAACKRSDAGIPEPE